MTESSEIYYRNTDLDLVSPQSLEPLIAHLHANGVRTFKPFSGEDGTWYVMFETDEPHSDPDSNIKAMLTAIESLPEAGRKCWNACTKRDFNAGFDSGDRPRSFMQSLSCETLRRIAACGATFTITIYPLRDDTSTLDTDHDAE